MLPSCIYYNCENNLLHRLLRCLRRALCVPEFVSPALSAMVHTRKLRLVLMNTCDPVTCISVRVFVFDFFSLPLRREVFGFELGSTVLAPHGHCKGRRMNARDCGRKPGVLISSPRLSHHQETNHVPLKTSAAPTGRLHSRTSGDS